MTEQVDRTSLPELGDPSVAAALRLPLAALVYDVGTFRVLAANDAACELAGRDRDELLRGTILDLLLPEDVEALRARIPARGPLLTERWRIARGDGSVVWVHTGSTDVSFRGRAARLLVAIDVTGRERALEELRASEARLRALVGSIDEVLFEFDRDATCLGIWTVNEALLVAPREQMLGRTVVELVGEQRGRPIAEAIARVIDSGRAETIEYDVDLADGTHWALARVAPIPGPDGRPRTASFLARDITSRVRAEQELRRAEERWRTLVEQLPAVVLVERPSPDPSQLLIEYLSPRAEEIYGYPLEVMTDARHWARSLHPEDRERVLAANARAEATGEPFDETYRVRRGDGSYVWTRSTSRLIRDPEGYPLEWVGVELDVTAQMEAVEALHLAEERYRTLVEQLPAVAFELVRGGSPSDLVFTYLSPQVERVFGHRAEELTGDPGRFAELVHPEDRERVVTAVGRASAEEGTFDETFRVLRPDGSVAWLHGRAAPVLDGQGQIVSWEGIALDVTAQIEAAEALRRGEEERRALLARLVSAQEEERARIAADIHDDPLQAIVAVGMQLDLLAEECEGSPALARIHGLRESVGRAVTRLRTLLFELAPPSLDSGLAEAVMELGARDAALGVELSVEDRSSVELPMEARAAAFRIVREALANVRKHARARRAWVRIEDRDGGVRILVEDDGVGIPPEQVEGAPGHFGLRSMRERAALCGGWLEVGPRPEGGTRVEVWLPPRPRAAQP